jgi:hypothetical protein
MFYQVQNIVGNARSRPCKSPSSRLIMSRTPRGGREAHSDHAHPRRRPMRAITLRHLRMALSLIPLV